jgi:LPS-assembly lipoprotein
MSSCDRRHLLMLLTGLPLVACGYTPAYAPGAAAAALTNRIEMDAPTSRDAFSFVSRMEDRLGRGADPAWRLSYAISTRRVDLAVDTSGAILRYNLIGSVSWQLKDAKTGAVVASGTEQNFSGSAATQATIPAQASEDDARQRLMVILADQVVTKLVAGAPAFAPATPA